jgi:hypothetical protein
VFRAILPNGQIECDDYDHGERGVELYDDAGELRAFVPYENLEALLTESAYRDDDPTVV